MRTAVRTLAILVLAGVALMRGAMPAGYMLAAEQTADGRFLTVQMCGAHQPSAVTIDLETGKTPNLADIESRKRKSEARSHSPCVFASAFYLSAAGIPEIAPHLRVLAIEGQANLPDGINPSSASPPPPATGPPLTI